MVTPRQVLLLSLFTGLVAGPLAQPSYPTYGLIDLSAVDPHFSVAGADAGNLLGQAMAMGDLNDDGQDDFAVTEPTATPSTRTNAGVVVLLDHELLRGEVDLNATDQEIQIWGGQAGDEIGDAVVIGDFNDDGLGDVAIGGPLVERGGVARDTVYIVWGTTSPSSVIDLASPSSPVTEIIAPTTDFMGLPVHIDLGYALAVADFDNDGVDDLVMGAPLWTIGQFGEEIGHVYVLYGDSGLIDVPTFDLHGTGTTFDQRAIFEGYFHNITLPPELGAALTAGDFDGDGNDDVVVGVPGYVPFNYTQPQGRAHVVYGSTSRPTATIFLDDANDVTTIEPKAANDFEERLGQSLAMGHYDADDAEDLLLGAPGDGGDDRYNGAAYLVRGDSFRPLSIFLSNTPGGSHVEYLGNSGLDIAGAAVEMVDIDGDGWDDPIIGAPGDQIRGASVNSGVVYAARSQGSFFFGSLTLQDDVGPAQLWVFGGLNSGEELGRTLTRGDLNGDGFEDLLFASPFINAGLGNDQGRAFGFPAIITRPRLIRAILVEAEEAGVAPSPGDHILLVFDRSVTVQPGPVEDFDLYLSNRGATLGTDATIEPSALRSNVLVVTLGETFGGIRVPGSFPSLSTAIDLRAGPEIVITDPNTDERAVDRGIQGVDGDDPVDLIWRFGGVSDVITSMGGTLQVLQNRDVIDYEYTGHRLAVPRGALMNPTTFDFTGLGSGFGPLGLTGGFGLQTDALNPEDLFRVPALLTFEYRDDDIDREAGQIEGLVRPFQVTRRGLVGLSGLGAQPGTHVVTPLPPGSVTSQDAEDNTITVEVNGLDPSGTGSPGTFATLPVNPVEERTIFINQGTGGAAATLSIATPVDANQAALLTPAAQSGYLLHTVEFPGYVSTASLEPGGYSVKIRQATIFERTTFAPEAGANMFPSQSGALYVIEVLNSSSSPVAFTDPVNVTVHFFDRTEAATTDIVDFDSKVGSPYQMRIVRSRVDTTNGPNFQFISGTQSLDVSTGVVSVNGHTGLTDANGLASWGTVVDTSVAIPTVTLQEIIDHILGRSEISQSDVKFDLADSDNDGDIDAADLVSFINN